MVILDLDRGILKGEGGIRLVNCLGKVVHQGGVGALK